MALPSTNSVSLGYEIVDGNLTVPSFSGIYWGIVRVAAPAGKVPIYGAVITDPLALPDGFRCESFPDATGVYPDLEGNGGWAFRVPLFEDEYSFEYRVIFTNA